MPAVTNPNPDRARRGGNAAATTAMVARAAASGEEEEPTAAIPAAMVVQSAPAAATTTQVAPVQSSLSLVCGRQVLEQDSTARKRHATVQRADPCWQGVQITDEEDAHQPRWQCLGCRLAGGHGPPVLTPGPTTCSASLLLLIRCATNPRHSPTCGPRPRAKKAECVRRVQARGAAQRASRRDVTRACRAIAHGQSRWISPHRPPAHRCMPAAAEPQSGQT